MSATMEYGSDYVKRAAADLLEVRPAYRELVGFYAEIFSAQEDARLQVHIEPFALAPDVVRIKLKEQFPLIQPAEMRFDPGVSQALFTELCRIAVDRRTQLAEPAARLREKNADLSLLFRSLLEGNDERVKEEAEALGVAVEALSFFLHHSLRPSLCRCAEALAGFFPEGLVWEKGYCPVCGSPPGLGWIEDDGRRFLLCSFCWHRWSGRRAVCEICGNSAPDRLSYRFSEEEKEYRLDLCDACRKYFKTVDTRFLARLGYPPLEHIASLHLDVTARELGYEPALPLNLPG